ncbi:hypothetical protein MTO96_035405 [Rhipicephalus appendiculatus]
MTEMGYQLINDLETTTRNALTSTQRDTNPDLTFLGETTRPLRAKWRNTEETLGSDHKILEIVIPFRGNIKESRQQHIVDWHDYRQKLEANGPETIEDIEAWANLLNGTIQSATQTNGRLATNVTIKWFPAHAGKLDESVGPNRNEEADREAHALTRRGLPSSLPDMREADPAEAKAENANSEEFAITKYGEVLQWYRANHLEMPDKISNKITSTDLETQRAVVQHVLELLDRQKPETSSRSRGNG